VASRLAAFPLINSFDYFWKGSKASANALPIWAKIFALPK
jgi:hypothetical protein